MFTRDSFKWYVVLLVLVWPVQVRAAPEGPWHMQHLQMVQYYTTQLNVVCAVGRTSILIAEQVAPLARIYMPPGT